MIPKGPCHFKKRFDGGSMVAGRLHCQAVFPMMAEVSSPVVGRPLMPQELSVRAVRESGMCFTASTGEHSVCLDYPLGPGATAGPTPLEMLLTSLAVCAGSTLGCSSTV